MGSCGHHSQAEVLVKDRLHQRDIGKVGSAVVRIVGDEDIPGGQSLSGHQTFDLVGHGPEMNGDMSGLSEQLARRVKKCARKVQPHPDVGAKGASRERGSHHLGHSFELLLEQRELDRVHLLSLR